jgi:surfeit locus 1 family protein
VHLRAGAVTGFHLFGVRILFWPTFFTIPAFITLIGLGIWQLDRLDRKLALIAQVQTRMAQAPELLPDEIPDPDALKFRRVEVTGEFLHDKEIHLLAHTAKGRVGYQVITPLREASGRFVLVNRGWVPDDRRDPASRADGQVSGVVTVRGLARPGWSQGAFVPDNAADKNFWFWGDLPGMAKAAAIAPVAPVFVEADDTPNPGGLPIGGQTRITFTNDHAQYAFTWFALSIVLLVVYWLYLRAKTNEQLVQA